MHRGKRIEQSVFKSTAARRGEDFLVSLAREGRGYCAERVIGVWSGRSRHEISLAVFLVPRRGRVIIQIGHEFLRQEIKKAP